MFSERHNNDEDGATLPLRAVPLAVAALAVVLVLAAGPVPSRASDEGDKGGAATRPAAPSPATAAPSAMPDATAPGASAPAMAADASAPAAAPAEAPAAPAAPADAPARTRAKKEPSRAAAAGVRSDGSALARAASMAIEKDGSLVARDALRLRLSAKGGLVSLSGTAGTIYDREQVTRDAEGTKGVIGVHPSITIKPASKVEAGALEAAVVEAVKAAGVAGPTFAVKASDDGTIDVNGEVTHEWTAVNTAKKVVGVTAIKNYAARLPGHRPPTSDTKLSIVEPSPEQDQQLATHVKEALQAAGVGKMDATVSKGIVTIGGRVSGVVEAIRAMRVASLVPGIVGVENKVTVPGRAYRMGETPDAQKVEREVRQELVRVTSRGGSFRIAGLGVHVNQGSVLLTGRVSSEDAAYAAVEAAASVYGVQEVVNALSYPTQG